MPPLTIRPLSLPGDHWKHSRSGLTAGAFVVLAICTGAACRAPAPREGSHANAAFTGIGAAQNQQAAAAIDRGDYPEAERLYTQVLEQRRRELGPESLDVASSLANLAWLKFNLKQYDQATALHREALAIRRMRLGDEHPDVARSLTGLGASLTRQAQYAEAEKVLTDALAILRDLPTPPHSYECVTLDRLVKLYESWDKPQQAEAYRQQL